MAKKETGACDFKDQVLSDLRHDFIEMNAIEVEEESLLFQYFLATNQNHFWVALRRVYLEHAPKAGKHATKKATAALETFLQNALKDSYFATKNYSVPFPATWENLTDLARSIYTGFPSKNISYDVRIEDYRLAREMEARGLDATLLPATDGPKVASILNKGRANNLFNKITAEENLEEVSTTLINCRNNEIHRKIVSFLKDRGYPLSSEKIKNENNKAKDIPVELVGLWRARFDAKMPAAGVAKQADQMFDEAFDEALQNSEFLFRRLAEDSQRKNHRLDDIVIPVFVDKRTGVQLYIAGINRVATPERVIENAKFKEWLEFYHFCYVITRPEKMLSFLETFLDEPQDGYSGYCEKFIAGFQPAYIKKHFISVKKYALLKAENESYLNSSAFRDLNKKAKAPAGCPECYKKYFSK